MGEQGLQRGRFGFLQLAHRHAVLRTHRLRAQQRRARVVGHRADRVVGLHRLQVALDHLRQLGLGHQPHDPGFGLEGLATLFAGQQVAAGTAVGIEHEERAVLALEAVDQGQLHDVLEHIGVVAGMEGVAIVHGRQCTGRRPQRLCCAP